MLSIKNGSKSFSGKAALADVTLDFERGKIMGIIGENGAGKTTLLRSLVGIYKLDGGAVTYDGAAIYNNPDARKNIGFVSEDVNVFPYKSVRDLIAFYKCIYADFSMEKFNLLNELFKIDTEQKIAGLSKGYKMRLSILLNLSVQPKFLLLDEPTNGLDVYSKKQFLDMLTDEVERYGTGVIISSHNLHDIEITCDDVCIINNGKILVNEDIERIKSVVTKLQVVFHDRETDVTKIDGLIDYKREGRVYYLYLEGYNKNTLLQHETLLTEICPMSLEDAFLKLNRAVVHR